MPMLCIPSLIIAEVVIGFEQSEYTGNEGDIIPVSLRLTGQLETSVVVTISDQTSAVGILDATGQLM